MDVRRRVPSAVRWLAASAGLAAGAYAAHAALTWSRYGRIASAGGDEHDELLDRFMPEYDVVERHHIRVAAPAAVVLTAAREQDLFQVPLVRAIIRAREMALGAASGDRVPARGLVADTLAMGWGVLADVPDREIVVGAVTKPWEPNVTFRPLPPGEFAAFREPGFVKIAWTLRADPLDGETSIFRTETRAMPTDAGARAHFRRYWAFVSPGIALIRWLSLRPLKREAERRAAGTHASRTALPFSPRAGRVHGEHNT